ncbi:hypothetical protein EN45_002490 [Penicillium chrysogenum]|jgi:hypothetical protein|uniref:Uncharacterized protein n=1 Tax=Penicillium chrysogenum TaxID=5076 RepID=A0A167V875_PENCH|nr:hypothetical protein EN45_002490 [Penicillium chrysogenum]
MRVWLHPDGLQLMEDIKRKGLNDVVFNAIALQELGARHQAQDDHGITGITKETSLVDRNWYFTSLGKVWDDKFRSSEQR